MTLFEQKLLEYLVNEKLLSQTLQSSIIKKAEDTKTSIEMLLTVDANISEQDILKAKKNISKEDVYDISEEVSVNALREIPEDIAMQYRLIPIEKKENKLIVGMVNPDDVQAREALRFLMLRRGLKVKIVSVSEQDFRMAFRGYKDVRKEISHALSDLESALQERVKAKGVRTVDGKGAPEVIKEAPITKIVAVILKHATEGKASDIHVEPSKGEIHVRFRVGGELYTSLILPATVHSAVVARIKILSGMRLDESRIPQDGRFRTRIGNSDIDFRVSTFPTTLGEKVVMRVLDSSSLAKNLEGLGLVGRSQERILEAIRLPYGLIFISGPTGSGKSTTLYVLLNLLPKDKINIVTLEDPVEYSIEGINQSEIRPEIEYTFASGLRHILRQDPDVIMVGEVRDKETAELVTHASLTGHIVFSTIHTNNAVGVIPRLVDMGVDHFLVPSALAVAVAQRLVRRLCDNCKEEIKPSVGIVKLADESLKRIGKKMPIRIWKAVGCKECGRKGYKGRIGIFEVLTMTSQLQRLVYDGASEEKISAEADRQGMITMLEDGIMKALSGLVSIEDVIRTTKSSDDKV